MSEPTNNTVNVGGNGIEFLLGKMDGKLDHLSNAMNEMKEDHRRLANTLSSSVASLETKIDTVELKLEVRIDSVETDIKAAKVERATIAKFMAVFGVVISAIWAVATWILPHL